MYCYYFLVNHLKKGNGFPFIFVNAARHHITVILAYACIFKFNYHYSLPTFSFSFIKTNPTRKERGGYQTRYLLSSNLYIYLYEWTTEYLSPFQ